MNFEIISGFLHIAQQDECLVDTTVCKLNFRLLCLRDLSYNWSIIKFSDKDII